MVKLLRYSVFFLLLSACTAHLRVSEVKSTHYELKTVKNDSIADLSVLPYKDKLDLEMSKVIAFSDSALTRDGFESSLGNFVLLAVEGYINTYKSDIAAGCILFINRGGLRNNLPKGKITKGHIFELMPFDNEIVILTISGQKLNEAIHFMVKENKLISYHLMMEIKNKKPENIILYSTPIEENKNYIIITTDYLAMGGDNCSFFGKPIYYENTGVKLRDAIIYYCEKLTKEDKHIKPFIDERIKISK